MDYFVKQMYHAKLPHSSSQAVEQASLGMRQSPRGLSEQLPTLGPSGRQLRLNCWEKKRRKKVVSHFLIVSSPYLSTLSSEPSNALRAKS